MDGWMKRERHGRTLVRGTGRPLAWVAFGLPLLALSVMIDARDAAAQSGVTLGSALDQPTSNDSLMPSGSFRLDGPGENSLLSETSGDPHAGTTSLGLQIYGFSSGPAPRPAENEAPPVPSSAPSLGGTPRP
jgi:hypothetical protein